MNILCIEDNKEKYDEICKQTKSIREDIILDWASYGNEGLFKLEQKKYDLVILDMSLPINSVNERKDMLYGESILDEIKRSRKDVKVVVVTGFDQFEYKDERLTFSQLYERLKNKFSKYLLDMVYYDQSSIEWTLVLKKVLSD